MKSGFPVIRSAPTVLNRENLNHSVGFPINNEEGEAGELDLAGAARSKRPAFWCGRDSLNGLVDFIDEPSRSALTVLPIPACRFGFVNRVWMEKRFACLSFDSGR